jgi:FkbM family methyltransferase
VSNCAFEHIQELKTVVEKIHHCLKPGGQFFTSFSPIWSGSLGHHYAYHYASGYRNFNHYAEDGIPPFVHLLATEEEVRNYYTKYPLPHGKEQLDALIEWCFHAEGINHLFYEDYERIVCSTFVDVQMVPMIWGPSPEPQILQMLQLKYPGYKRFDAQGMVIRATKSFVSNSEPQQSAPLYDGDIISKFRADINTIRVDEIVSNVCRLTSNTDELSKETAAYLVKSYLGDKFDFSHIAKAGVQTFAHYTAERSRLADLAKKYKIPYVLPKSYTENALLQQWGLHTMLPQLATHDGLTHFPQSVLMSLQGRDVIDGGGFVGDSALGFAEYGPRAIYTFEANPETMPILQDFVAANDKRGVVHPIHCALGKTNGEILIATMCGGDGSSSTVVKSKPENRTYKVPMVTIDEFVKANNLNLGLIKLDVEGAESDVIEGAIETIKRDKPLLLISIYHTAKDFFEIKPKLEALNLGYKFMIRHLMQWEYGDYMLVCYTDTQKSVPIPNPSYIASSVNVTNSSKESRISVFFSADPPIYKSICVAMASILENNRNHHIDFYVLTGDFDYPENNILLSLKTKYPNCDITFIRINKETEAKFKFQSNIWKVGAMYRLLIPELVPNLDKALWLDNDVLVEGDLSELWNTDIERYYIAGKDCLDLKYGIFENINYKKKMGFSSDELYVITGVLLFNCKKMREDRIVDKFFDYIINYGLPFYLDVDIINAVCRGQIRQLENRYGWDISDIILVRNKIIPHETPIISHFCGHGIKPWLPDNQGRQQLGKHERHDAWYDYLAKTPYGQGWGQ